MKKLTLVMMLLLATASLGFAARPGATTLSPGQEATIQSNDSELDPGSGGNGCSQYDKTVHGSWQDWYENNYRGWAKVACYSGAAAGVVLVGAGTGSTAAAAIAAAFADAGKIVGCDSITKQSGAELIRIKVGKKRKWVEYEGYPRHRSDGSTYCGVRVNKEWWEKVRQ